MDGVTVRNTPTRHPYTTDNIWNTECDWLSRSRAFDLYGRNEAFSGRRGMPILLEYHEGSIRNCHRHATSLRFSELLLRWIESQGVSRIGSSPIHVPMPKDCTPKNIRKHCTNKVLVLSKRKQRKDYLSSN